MPITLNWPSQAAQSLSAIEVYRSESKIDELNPGAPLATLAHDATTYADNSVVENKNYYYSVVAVKNGNRTFGAQRCIPFLSKYGPEPSVPLNRGFEDCRYIGSLTPAEFIDATALKSLLGAAGAMVGAVTGWYKFLYKGKILYFPNVFVTSNYTQLNQWGVLFGENDPAKLPSWAAASVDHKRIITVGENEYIVRLVKASNLPFTEFLTTQDQLVDSEYRDTIARLSRNARAAAAVPTEKPRLGEMAAALGALCAHLGSATTCCGFSGGATTHEAYASYGALTSAVSVIYVLELIP